MCRHSKDLLHYDMTVCIYVLIDLTVGTSWTILVFVYLNYYFHLLFAFAATMLIKDYQKCCGSKVNYHRSAASVERSSSYGQWSQKFELGLKLLLQTELHWLGDPHDDAAMS